MCNKHAAGFTLIEMIIAIVIISVGLAGVLTAFNITVKSSADPMIRKQMLSIAEEMMEEILLKPFYPPKNGFTQTNTAWPVVCGTAGAVRSAFDDVTDYASYDTTGICDIESGGPVDGLGTYNIRVVVDAAAILGVLPAGAVKQVTVTVTHGAETLSLSGWRTAYADCDSATQVCP